MEEGEALARGMSAPGAPLHWRARLWSAHASLGWSSQVLRRCLGMLDIVATTMRSGSVLCLRMEVSWAASARCLRDGVGANLQNAEEAATTEKAAPSQGQLHFSFTFTTATPSNNRRPGHRDLHPRLSHASSFQIIDIVTGLSICLERVSSKTRLARVSPQWPRNVHTRP